MKAEIPWGMAIVTNGQKCSICYRNGVIFSFGERALKKGLHQADAGFWKEIRRLVVKHFLEKHPEYRVTRLREGPK